MKFKQYRLSIFFIASFVVFSSMTLQSCIFSKDEGDDKRPPDERVFEDPITAKLVIQNLEVSFSHLEPDWYERCLHKNFIYEVQDKTDENPLRWARDDELRTIKNLMTDCTQFIFTASENSSYEEWGSEVPDPPTGTQVSDAHPNEIWYIFDYLVTMNIFTKTYGDFQVKQDMIFKMVKDSDTGFYSIVSWVDVTPE
ncbi:MAG: hypothetical protein JXB48_15595 [Candidatus Latescibacteria bacterium]|nr:hypothetical protein [Candidatus Latescibacterota bacterium]